MIHNSSTIMAAPITLEYDNQSYVFVILRHVRNADDNYYWVTSYRSIRKLYNNKIVIIDDYSEYPVDNIELVNTEIIASEFKGAGECLPYYYFMKYQWADRMVLLHDSMCMVQHFQPSELESPCSFHFHFEQKYVTGYMNDILKMISFLENHSDIRAYTCASDRRWKGCFGAAGIVSNEAIQYLETKFKFFSILVQQIHCRYDREIFERVIAVGLYYGKFMDENKSSNFCDIDVYPCNFQEQINTIEAAKENLTNHHYNFAIVKMWRGR